MNATVKRIRDIIKADVCGECLRHSLRCDRKSHPICQSDYRRQAQEIYQQVVEPLERRVGELAVDGVGEK